ncbi:MAG: 50S ribosomal protein L31 [Candidatus Pacebacteria bacterium]|jgi:large subunit ribosomal protein L31|nr:50S ribosomal protein L31 [Candidatus Paceibacterota bacterium]MBT3511982.1 50S ribosomal protein L31 [Candidatus Paceibacterota bacterium]MBT4005304.1 50S ribosomal protein L31 [Candidatus Paceibacterota bacterium]MBT4358523.1 50S ribosomal protein L31 [Candidatus Paceibacterota bacterium]MBT4680861.1 50S ribosomal protein L31 [Candidatus Paceibacterota bacterium]
MKQGIHPKWHHDAVVSCACGNTFTTGSIQKTIEVDICSACHPFFTGEMKFVDRQGRVDKFKKKMAAAQAAKKTTKKKSSKKQDDADQKSYKQLLGEEKTKIKKSSKTQVN